MNNNQKRNLTYDVIIRAVNGENDALESVLEYYEPLIIKMSKIPIYEDGNVKYIVKQDLYIALKSRLYDIIKKFNIE